jgi:Na+-driven multidrug efflux pump
MVRLAAARDRLAPEVKQLLLIGGPMIFVNVFSYAVRLISLMFVGRLQSDADVALSMSSLATSIANMIGVSVLVILPDQYRSA